MDLTLELQPINMDVADAELRELLGETFLGLSVYKDITVHLKEDVSKDVEGRISDYFAHHDPTAKSEAEIKQEAAVEAETRLQSIDLDALEAQIGKTDTDTLLRTIIDILRDIQKTR